MSTNGRPPLRVLLVEDSTEDEILILRELRKTYRLSLKRVETEAALALALDAETWDVVICDYILPAFSARKALELVIASKQHAPFIVISGSVDESIAIEILLAGAHDFIEKSKLPRLILAIQRELRQAVDTQQYRIDLDDVVNRTIEAWAKALELRDHFTSGHTQRVTDLTLRMVRQMEISKDQFTTIHRGALLHDIGKMGIPDAVLLKPDVLDKDEEKIMRMHPTLALEMLEPIPLLKESINIPYRHHEHWDGSGYPGGLKGDAIPFEARIFAVVDVYDALTSDRPYRKSWDPERALSYLQEQKGKLFDPEVVDRFVELIRAMENHP